MSKAHNYKDLEVWQLGRKLAVKVYRLSATFPTSEQFGLTSQVRRAATSVPLNIAEGHGLRSNAGFARHLKIALGSLNEVETVLIIASDLDMISAASIEEIQADCTRLAVKISNLLGSFSAVIREAIAGYGDDDPEATTYPQTFST